MSAHQEKNLFKSLPICSVQQQIANPKLVEKKMSHLILPPFRHLEILSPVKSKLGEDFKVWEWGELL
jgi:hypothetical protein